MYKVRPKLSDILLLWSAWRTCHLVQKLDLKSFFLLSVPLLFFFFFAIERTLTNHRQTQGYSHKECSRFKVNKCKGCMGILMRRIKEHYCVIGLLNAFVTIILVTFLAILLHKKDFHLRVINLREKEIYFKNNNTVHLKEKHFKRVK